MKNNKGFTLIEVLVVVLILAILSGIALSMLNSGGYRQKARDSQRVSDLKRMQQALELYYADYRRYPSVPVANNWLPMNHATILALGTAGYISAIPSDPSDGNPSSNVPISGIVNGCLTNFSTANSANYYLYTSSPVAIASKYVLAVMSETPSSGTQYDCLAVPNCTNGAAAGCNCTGATRACYAVQNP